MRKALRHIITFWLLLCTVQAGAQRFYNLTADEVSIDSVLPRFSYSIPLEANYADSIYQVSIDYPEFIPMSAADRRNYARITQAVLPELPVVEQRIVVNRKKGALEVSFVPLARREGRDLILVSFMLRVEATAKNPVRRAPARASQRAGRYKDHSVLATGKWAKISVASTGVHQLTAEVAKQAGFTDLSRVRIYGYGGALQNEELVGDELQALDDLQEVPSCMVGGRRLFYAKGPVNWTEKSSIRTRNPYSNIGCYFITESDGEPLAVDSAAFVSSFYPANGDYHALHEVDNYAWFYGGRNLFENAPIAQGASKDYTLDTPSGAASTGTVRVRLSAGSNSTAQVAINGEVVGQLTMSLGDHDFGNMKMGTYNVALQPTNTITITTLSGGPVCLDFIDIEDQSPRVAPRLSTTAFPAAQYVYNITNQDHHGDDFVDMVIVIPTTQQWVDQAQRLADYHVQRDGLRVRVVPADELFNEFSSGTPDANAYRRYLKMLYDRADQDSDMPSYLLLFGDCFWDNRMVTNTTRSFSPDDFLLCYESENSFSSTDCYVDDGFFCLLDDGEGVNLLAGDKLDVAVGRLPVRSAAQAKVVVDKSITYMENKDAGDWQNIIVFMGDDGNNNLHMNDVNQVSEYIEDMYPGYYCKRVMWDAYTMEKSAAGNIYPEVTALLKKQQADGALIMDYGGHGSEIAISHERVLKLSDFQQFTNTHMPLWITASCDVMPFDGPVTNIGEECVLNSKGGSMAFFGTTRTVWTNYNRVINRAFLRYVLSTTNGKPTTLGEAQRLAKNYLITSGEDRSANKLQYSLLGDPAMALNRPMARVVVDSINGKKADAEVVANLPAGSVARVAGHVETQAQLDESFNGMVSVVVRDTKQRIVCHRNNEAEASSPFIFEDRQNVLFNGADSVRNGKFSFTFAVPMDINYSEGTGLMNLYALKNDYSRSVNGAFERFQVNGSAATANDSIGPSIYCYLNSPSFTNGGKVNSTPFFVAQVTDKDGINATGTGIGHDLELIIDDEMMRTYNLNNNFSYDFGTYTSGQTFYTIPELAVGKHKLKFRAWDILNNSSTAELSFEVANGLEPTLFSVSCTDNPASTTTTFILNHDRRGCQVDVELEVFDLSGRLLWRHEETGVSTDNTYTMQWDLTVDGGQRLQTGVYLYRVLIGSDGSQKASKAKKLVIIGNN
jgi:hypothetical protein